MSPDQFMHRLVALVRAPRANLTRYHGVFAANHRLRSKIVPGAEEAQLELFDPKTLEPRRNPDPDERPSKAPLSTRPGRYDWASLLRRVFEIDVTVCTECGGPMKMIATITQPDVVQKILRHLGLPTEDPATELARGPPTPS